MGYTILLQWIVSSTRQPVPQTEIILTRVLEHYQIQYSTRTSIKIRIFRAREKTLSLYQYQYANRDREKGSGEEIAYLFLEDKSSTSDDEAVPTAEDKIKGRGEEVVEDEDLQVIEPSKLDRPREEGRKRKRIQYQTLAVKPAGSVVPMLQNLLNPFVMGVTKSARQAASTTAQKAIPTALAGTTTIISGYQFPTLSEPYPPITLTIHTPQTSASTRHTILEAEYNGYITDSTVVEEILKEFLGGCIPDGAGGEYKWWTWGDDDIGVDGWEGTERQRRLTQLLGKCMREGAIL